VVHGRHHLLSTGSRRRSTTLRIDSLNAHQFFTPLEDRAPTPKEGDLEMKKKTKFFSSSPNPYLEKSDPVPERSLVEPLGEARRSRGASPERGQHSSPPCAREHGPRASGAKRPESRGWCDPWPTHFRNRMRMRIRMNKKKPTTYHLLLTTNYQTTTLTTPLSPLSSKN